MSMLVQWMTILTMLLRRQTEMIQWALDELQRLVRYRWIESESTGDPLWSLNILL